MLNNIDLIVAEGERQGLTGRQLKGFVRKKLRKIIKKLKKEGKI